jgi:hypothetical protein
MMHSALVVEAILRNVILASFVLLAGCATTDNGNGLPGKDIAGTAGNLIGAAQLAPAFLDQCSERYPDRSQEFSRLNIKYKRDNEWIIEKAY